MNIAPGRKNVITCQNMLKLLTQAQSVLIALTNFLKIIKLFSISKLKNKHTFANLIKEIIQMVDLTDAAKEQLDLYFNGKEKAPIRIFINAGG